MYKKMLDNLLKYENDFFEGELDKDGSDCFRKTIQSDLRQTYFHAIETFFEIFFALNPKENPGFDDTNILFTLTNSDWRKSYNKIKKIASGEMSLDYLNDQISWHRYNISIGHYLFYFGLFNKEKFDDEFFAHVNESIEAIRFGIKKVAEDFVEREEYNSYKHGLRIIPAISQLLVADVDSLEVKVKWDLSDSMSFYSKTKDKNELRVVTKLFDSQRDYEMTLFCSNMVSNMIYYRQISMYKEKDKRTGTQIPVAFFGREEIEKCLKINVDIQNLVYTVRRVEGDNQVKTA
jgi:hypothetical protein